VVAKGRITCRARSIQRGLLVAELAPGAFDGVSGAIRPDWPVS